MAPKSRSKEPPKKEDAWYAEAGKEQDVFVSSHIVMYRNLVNYPFAKQLNDAQSTEVSSIIHDVFNHMKEADRYKSIFMSNVESLGMKILIERGVYEANDCPQPEVIIRDDGKFSCEINVYDHMRLHSIKTGFAIDEVSSDAFEMDENFQQKLQFAASHDFGFLTANPDAAGSGMKIKAILNLWGISQSGLLPQILKQAEEAGIEMSATFCLDSSNGALGSFYTLTNHNSLNGSAESQMENFNSFCQKILAQEKEARAYSFEKRPLLLQDSLNRSWGLANSNLFLAKKEAIKIISDFKMGKYLNLITGIEDNELNALLFRIQNGHLEYVLKNGNLEFPEELMFKPQKKVERLRSIILKETLENVILK